MAGSEDLINFDVIEAHKENIQALPSGRSAKKLADLFSPSPLHKLSTPTPSDTKNINDCIRAEYEAEIVSLSESDDPLDVFDRYVRWTLDAYPSAQATPQSQLHTLLERATKTFVHSAQYKNDPRYLKMWLHYIQFFSDAPRETFVYLSRHNIGEGLALFYEEYAAWLEGAGRWAQAEEVYKLGIEREARPVQRLLRKFKEFEERLAQQPEAANAPSSPALPTVRPALAAKVDPFTGSSRPADPQAPRPTSGLGGQSLKSGRSKLTIFSDTEAKAPALPGRGAGSKGWDTIGSLAERKKENVMEPKPWVGETLKAGGKKRGGHKLEVFKDTSVLAQIDHFVVLSSEYQVTMNPATGKRTRIYVDLATLYPRPDEPGTELSFEEVWLMNRGWMDRWWDDEPADENSPLVTANKQQPDLDGLGKGFAEKLMIHQDPVMFDENGAVKDSQKESKGKKMKVVEVNRTQIIKANLDSPSKPRPKKKGSGSGSGSGSVEPTMTLHTKAATDEIYEIFNKPLQATPDEEEANAEEDDYETDGDYTSGAESTTTTRQLTASEVGDDVTSAVDDDGETGDVKSVSEWTEFSAGKHIPDVDGLVTSEVTGEQVSVADVSDLIDTSDPDASGPSRSVSEGPSGRAEGEGEGQGDDADEDNEAVASVDGEYESPSSPHTTFIPMPPDDYEPRTRPYRDPAEAANNRLPFMTPITERTECSLDIAGATPWNKTPPNGESSSDEVMSSPLIDIINEAARPRIAQPSLQKTLAESTLKAQTKAAKVVPPKGPIIQDTLCNPVDQAIRDQILASAHPPLASYTGFHDHGDDLYGKGADLRKFIKINGKNGSNRNSTDKTSSVSPPVVQFPGHNAEYIVRRELGAGAFAPVYLVENSCPDEEGEDGIVATEMAAVKSAVAVRRRSALEALKMEMPPTAWEFYMMRLAHARLGPHDRATASLSYAHEMHLYRDEGFLFMPFHPHGTLLEVINFFRAEPSGVMDEQLAMFFAVELLRTVEALHGKGLMHGDLKPDNCLLRIDAAPTDAPLASQYKPDGSGGWAARGVTLIDFGRGVDMRAFRHDVSFVADWKPTAQDCAEMREGRPWTWQMDYHGLAGIIHCLLFGKYMETVRADSAGGLGIPAATRYRVRESLKRYWQADIWQACFDLLLNPASKGKMPVLAELRTTREAMEAWLVGNCERGAGLKALVGKVEGFARGKRW